MSIKNRISSVLEPDKLEHKENINCSEIHIADLTERTKSKENLKIYRKKPDGIDTLLIENPNSLDVSPVFFKPQCFNNEQNKEIQNCEGMFYLTSSNEQHWVLFIEIKDCKSKNISEFFEKAKEQIISTVKFFRNKEIIINEKVYANISFPRRNKTDFYKQLIKNDDRKKFIDEHKIYIKGTNHLTIQNSKTIK